jgi:diaminopimelate epimerase
MIRPELMSDGQLQVDMGAPFLEPTSIPTTLESEAGLPRGSLEIDGVPLNVASVGMGNPHVVVPVDDLSRIPFEEWGAALEVHPVFPAKTNVHFLKVHSRDRLEIRVWERGAGPTLACGTGACATLVAAVLLDLADEQAEVMLPGGPLLISWPGRTGSVLMTGPAEAVFDGVITPELVPGFSPSESTALESEARTTPDDTRAAPSPEDEAAALAKVQAFLNDTSLDSMLNLASDSFEQRTRSRFERGGS